MSTDLIKSLPNVPAFIEDDGLFSKLASSEGFLPRLQLVQKTSKIADDDSSLIGNFVYAKAQETINLGPECNACVLVFRYRATTLTPEPLNYFDPQTDKFREIMDKQEAKVDGYFWGFEFLLALEKYGLCSIYLNSKSARNVATDFRAHLGKFVTIKSKKAENKKGQTWSVISVTECQTPFEIQDEEAVRAQAETFVSAQDSKEPEKVEETSSRER